MPSLTFSLCEGSLAKLVSDSLGKWRNRERDFSAEDMAPVNQWNYFKAIKESNVPFCRTIYFGYVHFRERLSV